MPFHWPGNGNKLPNSARWAKIGFTPSVLGIKLIADFGGVGGAQFLPQPSHWEEKINCRTHWGGETRIRPPSRLWANTHRRRGWGGKNKFLLPPHWRGQIFSAHSGHFFSHHGQVSAAHTGSHGLPSYHPLLVPLISFRISCPHSSSISSN